MLINANSLHIPLRDESVQCVITSPPYWGLRDYNVDGQLGLEPTPEAYTDNMVQVFREVWRVLKKNGTLFLNIGDSYANPSQSGGGDPTIGKRNLGGSRQPKSKSPPGLKPKDLVGIPWRLAFALQADGWWLRQDLIWHKPNAMPESCKDRCTKAHEYVFLLTKSQRYYWDWKAVQEASSEQSGWARQRSKGVNTWKYNDTEDRKAQTGQRVESSTFGVCGLRNKRSVWTIPTEPTPEAHFATFPQKLVEPCILAGSRLGDIVLDPFGGSGTVGIVAHRFARKWVLLELSKPYLFDIAQPKLRRETAQTTIANAIHIANSI